MSSSKVVETSASMSHRQHETGDFQDFLAHPNDRTGKFKDSVITERQYIELFRAVLN